jgi:hypothetical protein
MDHDVKDILSSTTLGPYSFDAFIQGAWTVKKVTTAPKGRRPLENVSTGHRKRPLAAEIAKTAHEPSGRKKRKSILAADEQNSPPVELNIRVTRSGRRQAK